MEARYFERLYRRYAHTGKKGIKLQRQKANRHTFRILTSYLFADDKLLYRSICIYIVLPNVIAKLFLVAVAYFSNRRANIRDKNANFVIVSRYKRFVIAL
jgi:hypothetical protein